MKPRYRITIVPDGCNCGFYTFTRKNWDMHVLSEKILFDIMPTYIHCMGYKI